MSVPVSIDEFRRPVAQSSQLSRIARESHAFQQNLTLSLTALLNSRKINKILYKVSIALAW